MFQCSEWWLRWAKLSSTSWPACMDCRRRSEPEYACSSSFSCLLPDSLFCCLTSCCRKDTDSARESRCSLRPISARQLCGRRSVQRRSTLDVVCCEWTSRWSSVYFVTAVELWQCPVRCEYCFLFRGVPFRCISLYFVSSLVAVNSSHLHALISALWSSCSTPSNFVRGGACVDSMEWLHKYTWYSFLLCRPVPNIRFEFEPDRIVGQMHYSYSTEYCHDLEPEYG